MLQVDALVDQGSAAIQAVSRRVTRSMRPSAGSKRRASSLDAKWEYEAEGGTFIQVPAPEVQPDAIMKVETCASWSRTGDVSRPHVSVPFPH